MKPRRIKWEKVVQLWNQGVPARKIAEEVGTRSSRIYDIVAKMRMRGEVPLLVRKRKIIDRKKLFQMLREGTPVEEIALKMGVHGASIYKLLSRLGKKRRGEVQVKKINRD